MKIENSLSQMIAMWSAEAVSRWGDDWPKISDHIASCYKALPQDEQEQLAAEASQTILSGAFICSQGAVRH
jgi:hypothetical protein